jgi:hypothetical protein
MADESEQPKGVPLTGNAVYDSELYGGPDRGGYNRTALEDEDDDQLDELWVQCMHAC